MTNRLSKIEYGLYMAYAASLRSEGRNTKVGCAVEDYDGRIIATGYNGYAPGHNLDDSIPDKVQARPYYIHAENNALALCRKGEAKVLYITHSPCVPCAQIIAAHGVKEVYYINLHETGDKNFNDMTFHDLFEEYSIFHRQITEKQTKNLKTLISVHKFKEKTDETKEKNSTAYVGPFNDDAVQRVRILHDLQRQRT